MQNKFAKIFVCLIAALGILSAAGAAISADDSVGGIRDSFGAIADSYVKESGADNVQDWLDGALADSAGNGAEWKVWALLGEQAAGSSGVEGTLAPDFTKYADALQRFVETEKISGAVAAERCALTLVALGREKHPFVKKTLEEMVGAQGLMSYVFGLHIMNNTSGVDVAAKEETIEKILELEKPTGGFAVTGDYGDVDATAMVLQALAPYIRMGNEADLPGIPGDIRSELSERIREMTERSLSWLSVEKQLENGGFTSYGKENPESAAQVIIAYTALGIDVQRELAAMQQFQLEDGSFCHEAGGASNAIATQQAFCAVAAVLKRETLGSAGNDSASLFLFDTEKNRALSGEKDGSEVISGEEAPGKADPEVNSGEVISGDKTGNGFRGNYKPVATVVLAGILLITAAILWILRKRSWKNFAFLVLIGGMITAVIWLTDIASKDEFYSALGTKENAVGTVTMTIRCDTIVGTAEGGLVPADGVILPVTEFPIAEGDTVYVILTDAARAFEIQMEADGVGVNGSGMAYVAGLANLYERDYGDLSGWMYRVNGASPSVGCGAYVLQDGDAVEWLYTTNMGEDLK